MDQNNNNLYYEYRKAKIKINHNLTLNLPDKVSSLSNPNIFLDYPWVESWAIWAHKCHQSVWKTWPQGVVEMSLSNVNESKQVEQATFIFSKIISFSVKTKM